MRSFLNRRHATSFSRRVLLGLLVLVLIIHRYSNDYFQRIRLLQSKEFAFVYVNDILYADWSQILYQTYTYTQLTHIKLLGMIKWINIRYSEYCHTKSKIQMTSKEVKQKDSKTMWTSLIRKRGFAELLNKVKGNKHRCFSAVSSVVKLFSKGVMLVYFLSSFIYLCHPCLQPLSVSTLLLLILPCPISLQAWRLFCL